MATEADARRLVDLVCDIFHKSLPSTLSRSSFRKRVAQAELAAVLDPAKLIPEARIAAAWNEFAETMHVPTEFERTEAEVHWHRDAVWISARMLWKRSPTNPWTVPTIYATRPDGSLAAGCRPLEAFRILRDFATSSEGLQGAREMVAKGELFSDSFPKPGAENQVRMTSMMKRGEISKNPVRDAQGQYVSDNGTRAYNAAVVAMLDRTLA